MRPFSAREGDDARPAFPREVIAAAVAVAVSLPIYVATLAPAVLSDDSAELCAAAHVLGIPHPTGYPLYMLLAKLFDLLPFGTPPVRIGLFSAICAAGAAALVAWLTARISRSAPAGILAGLVAAFNGPMWSKATQVEVYALNALIVALGIAVFVRWTSTRSAREITWLAILTGLGLAHHRTAIFFTGPLLLAAVIGQKAPLRSLVKTGLAGMAPLLTYLYLPIRSAAYPPVMRSDLTRWEEVIPYLMAEDYYAIHAFARHFSDAGALVWEIARDLSADLTLGGVALAAVGLAALLRRSRLLSATLLIGVALLSFWNLGYEVPDIMDFFIPCALAVAVWAGAGLATIIAGLRGMLRNRARWALPTITAAVLIFVPASLIQQNWDESSHRGEWVHTDVVRAVLPQIAPDGVLVTNLAGDYFVSLYLQVVEGLRRDIAVVSPYGAFLGAISDQRIVEALPSLTVRYGEHAAGFDRERWSRQTLELAFATGDVVNWDRPVYCRARMSEPPLDPSVRALWWDFFRLRGDAPRVLVPLPERPAVAEFPGGISLVRATVEPTAVRPRDLLQITTYWRCAAPVEPPPFVAFDLSPPQGRKRGRTRMMRSYGTWLGYGTGALSPTPTGSVYRQELTAMVPTDAPEGQWTLWLAVSDSPQGKAQFHRVGEFRVRPSADPRD